MIRRLALAGALALPLGHDYGSGVAPAGVPVRWAEGTLHGFLELRTLSDSLLAHGAQLQIPRDTHIESRLEFDFGDGSVFRESVTFTQRGVFALQRYHLVQRGNAFAVDLDAQLDHTGEYVVQTRSHEDGKEERFTGRLDVPADLYNGLIPVIAKNLPPDHGSTVHVVAFTPQPRVIELELIPEATNPLRFGSRTATTVHFTLKPHLGLLLGIGAALTGKSPPDSHLWIVTEDVPAFVRFEGPLYEGPVWRINLTTPRWPETP
ncbi:MAG: hypothetical protein ACREMN_05235 [Gemmatimonadales bacterium]